MTWCTRSDPSSCWSGREGVQVLLGHLLLGGDVDSLGAGEHVGSEVAVSCRNVLFGALVLLVMASLLRRER